MELQKLLEKTVEYALRDGYLKESTTENPQLKGIHPSERAELREFFPPIKQGIGFEELVEGADKLTEQEAFKRINANIPNTPYVQLIEFCSGPGIRFGYGFAKRHPETPVVLVDKLSTAQQNNALYKEPFEKHLRARGIPEQDIKEMVYGRGFERYDREAEPNPDINVFMERLFRVNRAFSMHYADRLLSETTGIRDLVLPNASLFCVGWNCEPDAGIYGMKEAVKNKAEAIALTLSGLEHISIKSPAFVKPFSQKAQGNPEWDKLMEKAQATPQQLAEKKLCYDYRDPQQRKIGFALKHARILDMLLWLEEQGYNSRLVLLDEQKPDYNGAEHIVYAFKNHDILK